MSRVNEEGIKVVLDGQGADELFGGYPHHRSFYALDLLKKVNLKSFGELLSNQSQGFENSRILRDYYVYNLKLRFPSLSRRIFKNRLFEHDYIAKDLQEPLQEKVEPIASFNSVLLSDYYNGYLKNLLRYEDRNSMHFSVESRTTFADDVNLMQWFLKAPKKYFFRNGFSKYLFRKALDHKLPNAITWRKDKIGFQVPNNEWMWELTKEKKDLIHSLPVEYFDTDKIIKDFDQLFNRSKQPENFRILKFISFAQWYDVFIS
ncbi:MAG: asparagine synthase C-terminal domain-containing protein, partial [Flavobacteriales bacterium]|nr:asparagine synthase C-terminal domain-containing protein [Flavobacteriales bacterium]